MAKQALHFLQQAAAKPDWAEKIKEASSSEILALARENGFECEWGDLEEVSREIIKGSDRPGSVSEPDLEEASAASTGFDERGGYGSDSGFALLSGIAAAVLKKSA